MRRLLNLAEFLLRRNRDADQNAALDVELDKPIPAAVTRYTIESPQASFGAFGAAMAAVTGG